MGITKRQFTGMLIIMFMLSFAAMIGGAYLSRASAEEAQATAKQAVWKVETFVEPADSPDHATSLGEKISRHLNGNSDEDTPNARATKVRLLLSYNEAGGSLLATLVYQKDEVEHYYKVHVHKCGTANKKHRGELKAELEKLLNTLGVEPHCLVQDSRGEQFVLAAVCEVK